MTGEQARIGSSIDDFLMQEGLHEEVTATAIRRLLTRQIAETMAAPKSGMVRRMNTNG